MKAIFDNIQGTCEIEGKVPNKIVCEYDAAIKTLKVARDKIGEQSLYYAQLPTSVVVSTELKEILPHIAYPAINMLNLAQPIRYNYPIDLQQTWIEQIKRVRAGEELTIDQAGIRSRIYWKRDHTPTFKGTKEEALAEALRLLRKSVKECVESSEGPVAVLLSGGIDSTSLAALTKEVQEEVHVISAGYKGNKNCDERPVAKRFAEEKGLIYHEIELDVKDFQSYLNEMMPYLDEPCFDINCMVQYALYKKASEMGYKTILCGLGGDELFYSYALRHREVAAIQLRHEFNQLYPIRKHKKEYLKFLLKNYKHLFQPNHPARIDESMLTPWTYADYTRFAKDATLGDERFADIDVHVSFPENMTIQSMYDFVASTFAVNMCVYMAEKLSQANGVTVLLPFINPEFVEFMDSLPMEIKFDMKEPKMFQKKMMAGIIPDYILFAAKRGFTPPFDFILQMNKQYKYKHIEANYCFYNSMVADMMIDKLLPNL
ncbi:MAG: asparagine synthase [Paludibacteraceae bacterium]|nr:asparagine synthase [Paludibacteraceae bacterium]